MKQHPFSLYDFLGYFTPGAILLYLIFIIYESKHLETVTVVGILDKLPTLKVESVILGLIISYSLGHLLSFFSSITVEKYENWRYGFPSRYLLKKSVSRFRDHLKSFHGFFWGVVIIIILLPTTIFDIILGKWFGFKNFYVRPLDSRLSAIIEFKIKQLMNKLGINKKNGFKEKEGEIKDFDFFRIVQHYTYDHSKCHQSKFSNYVALYGFLRNMTLILNILSWYFMVHFIILNDFKLYSCIVLLITSIISYTFFMAYMKFYRRYTLEGFMVLVIDIELVAKHYIS